MTEAATKFPLVWPVGWPVTPNHRRQPGKFKAESWLIIRELENEVARLGGTHVVISSNVAVRQDGLPYADALKRKGLEPGVAVYFQRKGKPIVFACDTFDTPLKNARAICLTIEAFRGIERWGASPMLERSLSAFVALPAPEDWRKILGFDPMTIPTASMIANAYQQRAKVAHPDLGGSEEAMSRLNRARDRALEEINAR